MTDALSSSVSIGHGGMILGSFAGRSSSSLSGLRDAQPLRYLGQSSFGPAHGGMPKFPEQLPGSASLSTLSSVISMKMAHIGREQQVDYRSPLAIRLGTILVFLFLLVGIIASIFEKNAFTAALVPAGFTLWAVLASVLRARGERSE